jgi:hypothetical protein
MARPKKTAQKSKASPPKERKSSGISQKQLQALLASSRRVRQDIGEINGSFGQEIRAAMEHHRLHRGAFRIIAMLDRKEPEKLAEFFEYFDEYSEFLRERAKSAPRMDYDEETATTDNSGGDGEDGEDDESDVRPDNIRPFAAA